MHVNIGLQGEALPLLNSMVTVVSADLKEKNGMKNVNKMNYTSLEGDIED